ncbi:reverse transcriptase [Gossypium australe]|uniref:Reverse transcriptase n=1 Tax=Gossypium australe TaxID=47621 RepID=A0A5B6W783_9ROSI|nr:reverse transcriptase [Gossypium australe]
MATQRKKSKNISRLEDGDGQERGKSDNCSLLSGILIYVTDGMNDYLNLRFIEENIEVTVQSLHPTKAPGDDGMPPMFYQQFWHIISKDVYK